MAKVRARVSDLDIRSLPASAEVKRVIETWLDVECAVGIGLDPRSMGRRRRVLMREIRLSCQNTPLGRASIKMLPAALDRIADNNRLEGNNRMAEKMEDLASFIESVTVKLP